MTKTILVPIDISAGGGATPAIAFAQDLAKSDDAKLVLLNVVPQFTGYTSAYLPDDFHEKAVAGADDALKKIAKTHGLAGRADLVVREGNPATEILTHARDIKADMIVLASHDPGLADYFLGSVAARVVRHAHCSVLVVRPS